MADYDRFAPFYDAVLPDPLANGARVLDAIERFMPEASSLLELGCGTGLVLAHLDPVTALTGLDRSSGMLEVAARRVPRARLVRGDMASFDLGTRFDVVICVFDTLNHLATFDGWK